MDYDDSRMPFRKHRRWSKWYKKILFTQMPVYKVYLFTSMIGMADTDIS